MNLKSRFYQFFRQDIRSQNGMIFFVVFLILFYFVFQLLFGRSNVFRWIGLRINRVEQSEKLKDLEKEVLEIKKKVELIKSNDLDYIDELLRRKLNRFPPKTYQIKEEK